MAVRFRTASGTHLGTVRMNNEDSALTSDRLLVLADGMGGHAAGEVASVVALRVFADVEHSPGADLGNSLISAGRRARTALVAMSEADPVLESLGTTLIAVVSDGDHVVIGHIGDSRLYVLRGDSMYQVTTDHTHVQRLVDQGQLSPDQVRSHPYRAMLLKSLDDHPAGPDLDVIELSLRDGDRLLVCSDGLSDYLSAEQIGSALATEAREDAVEALIDAALQASTRDNVTVIVADVDTNGELGPASAPEFTGAVADEIRLSQDASRALAAAVPGLALDPQAPWRDATLAPAADQDGVDVAASGDHDRTDTEKASVTDSPTPSAAVERAESRAEDAAADGASFLPGVLAGSFTIAVLVLLSYFLFF